MRKKWSGPFRRRCPPILRGIEDKFADPFDPKMGRPNRPVALVIGTLILKEKKKLAFRRITDKLIESLGIPLLGDLGFSMAEIQGLALVDVGGDDTNDRFGEFRGGPGQVGDSRGGRRE